MSRINQISNILRIVGARVVTVDEGITNMEIEKTRLNPVNFGLELETSVRIIVFNAQIYSQCLCSKRAWEQRQ